MPLIWCSISGHGFGHAAQLVPMLNELGRRLPQSHFILRTTVPRSFFQKRLQVSWTLHPCRQDIGCIQQGPLHIDIPATWDAYQQFHRNWDMAVSQEMQAIKACAPRLILSNISYLAIEAGYRAGIPTVGYGSLSWDGILSELTPGPSQEQKRILQTIVDSYGKANLMIKIHPGMAMPAFSTIRRIGPVCRPLPAFSPNSKPGRDYATRKPVVFAAFGGIPINSLPLDRIDSRYLDKFDFVADMPLTPSSAHIQSIHAGRKGFDAWFQDADILLSKPGYATVVEAVQLGKPLVYVRRYNFADEPPLVEYAHRFGRACELSREDFFSGRWEKSLETVLHLDRPTYPPPESGIHEGASLILQFL